MPLIDAEIRALQPRPVRYLVSDGRGLSLDVLPSGIKTWLYRYRQDGIPQKVTLGRYPDLTLKTARQQRDKLASQVAVGKSPAEEKKARREGRAGDPTVKEFGARFYREVVVHNRKNPSEILRVLTKEIYPAFGDKKLKDVTVLDVQAIVYRKRDAGQVSTAIQLRGIVKMMYDYAINGQLVLMNPATMLATKYIGRSKKRSRFLSPRELRHYLQVMDQSDMRIQFKIALRLLLLTLTRKSELLLARWEHINLETGEWYIPAGNMKMGRPHMVYLSKQAIELFRELQGCAGASELVLPGARSSRKPYASNALNKALERLLFGWTKEEERTTIHDLRRTGATYLTENGFAEDVIEKALAHERRGIRAHYILAEHAAERRRMLQWWADHIDGVINGATVIVGKFDAA